MEEKNFAPAASAYRAARDAGRALRKTGEAARAATESFNALDNALPRTTTLPALIALARTGKHIYAGTADPVKVRTNRKRNKVARRQRRVNVLRNARKGVR